jgi:hypothetical protein
MYVELYVPALKDNAREIFHLWFFHEKSLPEELINHPKSFEVLASSSPRLLRFLYLKKYPLYYTAASKMAPLCFTAANQIATLPNERVKSQDTVASQI